jgi:hypothetical protein
MEPPKLQGECREEAGRTARASIATFSGRVQVALFRLGVGRSRPVVGERADALQLNVVSTVPTACVD